MTERRLDKNPELKKKYHSAMEEYFNEGYAEKIEKPITEDGWYLPHHPVIHSFMWCYLLTAGQQSWLSIRSGLVHLSRILPMFFCWSTP